jgi:hypothetical protein
MCLVAIVFGGPQASGSEQVTVLTGGEACEPDHCVTVNGCSIQCARCNKDGDEAFCEWP